MQYKGKNVWSDEPSRADCYRKAYADGIEYFIKRKNAEARVQRERFMPPEFLARDPEKYRAEYLQMLGVKRFDGVPKVERVRVGEDDFSVIYRLTVYVECDVPFYAMLLLPKGREGKAPLVIFQHGGGGTPELASDFYGKNNYNLAVRRFAERGCAILLPQLLLWSREKYEAQRAHPIPHDRAKVNNELKRFGTSITGFEIGAIMRCIDYAVTLDEINSEKIAMSGLSYGGYFTLHTMAADTRIKAGYACCAFSDRDVYSWQDWTYFGSANKFHDAEVAGLCAPRKLVVEIGKADPVFDYKVALPEIERVGKYFDACGAAENFKFNLHEGGHTFTDADEYFDFILKDLD